MNETSVARHWWLVVLRGVLAILFGVVAFIWPGLTVVALVLMFGAYAFIDGIFAVVAGVTNRNTRSWGWQVLEGIVGIVASVLAFIWPGITAVALLYLIAAWAVVTGVFGIAAAIRLRHEIENEWLLGLSGLLSVVLGVAMLVWPGAGVLAVVWLIGSYAILFGILLIALGVRLRTWTGTTQTGRMPAA